MLIAESSGRYVLTSNRIHTHTQSHTAQGSQISLDRSLKWNYFTFAAVYARPLLISLYLMLTVRNHSMFDTNGFNTHTHIHTDESGKKELQNRINGCLSDATIAQCRSENESLFQLLPYTVTRSLQLSYPDSTFAKTITSLNNSIL